VCNSDAIEPRDLPMSVLNGTRSFASGPPLRPEGPPRAEISGARDELLELVRVAKNQPRVGLIQALEVLFGTLTELPSADEVEFALIERALKLADGNVNEAARVLGLSRATIYRRLRKDKPEGENN